MRRYPELHIKAIFNPYRFTRQTAEVSEEHKRKIEEDWIEACIRVPYRMYLDGRKVELMGPRTIYDWLDRNGYLTEMGDEGRLYLEAKARERCYERVKQFIADNHRDKAAYRMLAAALERGEGEAEWMTDYYELAVLGTFSTWHTLNMEAGRIQPQDNVQRQLP